MTANELTCQELVELVTDYLEGAMAEAERLRFEQHLDVCEGCRNHVDQMRTTIQLVGHLSEETIDPAARDELLGLFRNWKRAPRQELP